MSNSTVALALKPYGKGGRKVVLPVGVYAIKAGTMVGQLATGSYVCPGSTALSGPCVGVAVHDQDNSGGSAADLRVEVVTDQIFVFANSSGDPCAETTAFGAIVYMEDDHTISKTNGGSQFAAGYFAGMEPDGTVRVMISTYRISPADLTTLATSAGAGLIGILDAGTFTAQTTVEAALAELYQVAKTVNASVAIPLASFLDADGDPLAKFIDASSPTFGFNLANSEGLNLRWNNDATPGTALCQFSMPLDIDDTAAAELEFLCSKSGATSGDATTLTVGAYLVAAGDLHDADTALALVTNAITGAATAKTTALLTATIGASDIQAAPRSMTFSVTPTAGLLGTDDFMIHAVYFRYKRKLLTS